MQSFYYTWVSVREWPGAIQKGERLPMLLSKAIEGYILDRTAGGYSPHTLNVHRIFLDRLQNYLGDLEIEKIKYDDLSRFMAYLHTEYVPRRSNKQTDPLLPASIDGHWKAIRSFFKWTEEALNLPRPDLKLKRPDYQSASVAALTEIEMRNLIKACEKIPNILRNKLEIISLSRRAFQHSTIGTRYSINLTSARMLKSK